MAARLIGTTDGAVMTLTLSDPASRNALGPELYADGLARLESLSAGGDIRAIVITGEGDTFCAGGNLRRLQANRALDPSVQAASIDALHRWILALRSCPLPVIAAVEGVAAGAGASLALACDMIVCGRGARLVMAYVKIGLSPDGGASHWLGERLPWPLAYELLATGAPIDATRLHTLGVVNRVVPDGEALAQARSIAHDLSRGPSAALGRIKTLLASRERSRLEHQLEAERNAMLEGLFGPEGGEGIAAFLDKRPADFRRVAG